MAKMKYIFTSPPPRNPAKPHAIPLVISFHFIPRNDRGKVAKHIIWAFQIYLEQGENKYAGLIFVLVLLRIAGFYKPDAK